MKLFRCQHCSQLLHFENHTCEKCGHRLGYIPEAETLAGYPVRSTADLQRAGERLRAAGPSAVLVKGGHASTDMVEDVLVSDEGVRVFSSPRIDSRNTHGTGCTLSTAIACGLAQGMALIDSIERARTFVREAIRTALGFGRGHGPLNHLHSITRP